MNGSHLDTRGREILDDTPVSVGVHFDRPVPLHIRIRNQILAMMQEESESEETFQDADDFDCGDDELDPSPYEMEDDYDHLLGGAGGTPPVVEKDLSDDGPLGLAPSPQSEDQQ